MAVEVRVTGTARAGFLMMFRIAAWRQIAPVDVTAMVVSKMPSVFLPVITRPIEGIGPVVIVIIPVVVRCRSAAGGNQHGSGKGK